MTATGKLSTDAVTAIRTERRVEDLSEESEGRAGEGAADEKTPDDAEAREGLVAELNQAKEEVARLRRAYAELTRSRDRSEEDMAAAQAALSGQVADQTDRLKELTDRNATLRSKLIDEQSRQQAAQQERLAAMREREAARQTRIEDLVEQKAALNTRIKELTGRIDELKERISAGQARLEEWRERDRSRQTCLEEQKARILNLQQALNERNDALAAARAAHSEEVARRKERVEALRSSLRVEREQRAAMLASVRWKAGDLVADAFRRPGLRTLALPIRLLMLVLRRSG